MFFIGNFLYNCLATFYHYFTEKADDLKNGLKMSKIVIITDFITDGVD
ncbi:hypothetical protein HMPREF0501_00577 [Limosilactobacillus coleohominis 101-4-CHN]|uniref:Uncharacterized protein n=1 Tax=Limosilactobacillus coleohominis 101-4-CHN TaxID=575594 RepID=C7XTJ9_9LACO|nr:hypothetical protein HMPREF0501_00577 [Limosilactobacillus coleohominis 101-4-CHN]